MVRAHQHATSVTRHTGGPSNDNNRLAEPDDHAIGRSRGGLSTKIHSMADGRGRPLVVLLGPGQGGDSPMFIPVMEALRVARPSSGRPRTGPAVVRADKAYSSRANCRYCRCRGVRCVIPVKDDQKAARKRRGKQGGREYSFDAVSYKQRNVVERVFASYKQWRALATRYDKLAIVYRAGLVLHDIIDWLT
ncbi:IS5 family transposase [Actinomyces bowdenii]|uniref:IS5 family transposase n=1 Tax=Actinomyces bowdenii TaxID=131109 RepID=A0A853EJ64_9ACTO|nr:IS5 family transposase [Actinomyces bowdenii]NYS68041.1 IS5 family transposase [Actinomyces bowdenii]